MKIIDQKIRKNISNYIFQCLLATGILLSALLFLNVITETALIASLGATSFIVFAMPKTYASSPRRLIGGYSIGIITGIICSYLGSILHDTSLLNALIPHESPIVFAAIAVGLSIFFMTLTNTEHAPAAGIALGLVINQWNLQSILFIVVVMLMMAIIHHLLHPYLIDLTSPKLQEPNEEKI
jgi:CBS-domain-containing membrane protein